MIAQKVEDAPGHNPCGKLKDVPRASGFVKLAGRDCPQIPVFGTADLNGD
jgi:hypothetical protein